MNLIYRGVTYDYNFLKASSRPVRRQTPCTLRYRGNTYQVTPKSETVEVPVQTVTRQLIYRGDAYWVTRTIAEVSNRPANHSEMILQRLALRGT